MAQVFQPLFFLILIASKQIARGLNMKTRVRVLRARDVSAISSNMSAVSRIQCEAVCVKSGINGCCRICGYNTATKTCFLSFDHEDDLIVHSDDTRMVLIADRTSIKYNYRDKRRVKS
ncbi:hypothetical protein MAR_034391 [Mya arenaria]|uniref:Uncharacterized protein n=1 Tax=Mya arenaria TaxID=6604 RepID=A0ABY7GE94_MYAAR|nr:hypothetical protein MAR_034391 [Mya arenaria]